MRLSEMRYVYKVEGAGKALETASLTRAYFYLGQLSERADCATLTVSLLDTTNHTITARAALAHSVDGALTEIHMPTYMPVEVAV